MRLLKTKIHNFQSLNEITIEHGDLTVLWGNSDLGKSACIRAIYSLLRNTCTPDDIRFGEAKLKVEQEYDDNTVVGFEKSKTTNKYYLNDKSFTKVGREIPDSIKEFLKVDELVLDKDQSLDLNCSKQFDPPFLLSDSSSIVTKTISSLSGIHFIYAALRDAATQTQRLKTQSQVLQTTIQPLERFEELLKESDNLKDRLNQLEKYDQDIKSGKEKLEFLRSLKERFLKLKTINVIPLINGINNLALAQAKIEEKRLVINRLLVLADMLKKSNKSDFSSQLSSLTEISSKLITVFSNIENKKTGYNNLRDILNKLNNNVQVSTKTSENLEKLKLEESELKGKIKICQTCGRPF